MIGEVVATVMELHPITMPRQPDIGSVAVHPRRRQHMRPIDRYTLRFVNGSGIAMIDMGIVFQVERDRSPVIEPHRNAIGRYALDLPQRAVLHP